MYSYSKRSVAALNTADIRLQQLFSRVIKVHDCTVIFGHRTETEQEEQYRQGHTGLHFPKSKHNSYPSLAVDVVPYPIDWGEIEKPRSKWTEEDWISYINAQIRFYYFAGIVKGIASQMNIKIRWGGDWDDDNDLKDQTWMDLPHFELIDEE